jgi:A/G-specific adenine glycosylase
VGRLTRNDRIAVALLKWGSDTLRDLPWRRTRNPWHVLVSEVMLQQTSVARVLPKFEAFINEFPTPHDLASAPLGDALRLWSGLGYPRRCRNLREAARVLHEEFNGEFPESVDVLLTLPGVGQYTSRAVLAFAFEHDVAVVDTNVSRVLSRLEGRALKAKELQVLADSFVPQGLGWEWNQVMMDFGARHCTARQPQCAQCPLRQLCVWKGEGVDPAPASAGASKPQGRFQIVKPVVAQCAPLQMESPLWRHSLRLWVLKKIVREVWYPHLSTKVCLCVQANVLLCRNPINN